MTEEAKETKGKWLEEKGFFCHEAAALTSYFSGW